MAKIRVYELAKSLNKDSKEVLEILKKNGVEVKNHMSSVSDEDAGKVRARFAGKPAQSAPDPPVLQAPHAPPRTRNCGRMCQSDTCSPSASQTLSP